MSQFDVIVIGGGIVGATAACALGREGLTVALVEARAPGTAADESPRDARMYAVTRASERIFTALGVWDAIAAQGISEFREMEVWDAGGAGRIHFDAAELGEPYLGCIIEPRLMQSALTQQLAGLAGVELFCPARFRSIAITAESAEIVLQEGQTLSAKLVIAADGPQSRVREQVGISVRTHDYRQRSLVALVSTERPHQDTAWQRFLPGGPLAFLPMHDGRCSIVWTRPADTVDALLALDEADFHAALGQAFDYRLGRITASELRQAYPLRRLHADHYVSARVALVGDAAHAIHPLAGQGVNLGLLDAATLAEVVTAAWRAGRDPGMLQVLRRYERWRRGDNLLMMAAMDGLNRLFSNAQPPLQWARNLGLALMNRAGPARRALMRHAMGFGADLPATAQPPERE
ncbi:MAG: UbiH/UbiF/VisC/COQ6 family ubiquinone biosynthesis hydroxylase [Gammaproteobacteria bacterium]